MLLSRGGDVTLATGISSSSLTLGSFPLKLTFASEAANSPKSWGEVGSEGDAAAASPSSCPDSLDAMKLDWRRGSRLGRGAPSGRCIELWAHANRHQINK
eukprot:1178246-Prorocentrum_minimum.AAC.7